MIARLDQVSRATVGRFVLKIGISVFIASVGKTEFIMAASGWLALYAFFTTGLALILRERFPANCFTHWDEALWLITASMGLRIVHKMLV